MVEVVSRHDVASCGVQVDGLMRRGELVSSETVVALLLAADANPNPNTEPNTEPPNTEPNTNQVVALLRRRMRAYPGRRLLLDGFPRSRQVWGDM